jgi:hypothetical protein
MCLLLNNTIHPTIPVSIANTGVSFIRRGITPSIMVWFFKAFEFIKQLRISFFVMA